MILYIGNILSSSGMNPSPVELIRNEIYKSSNIKMITASNKKNRIQEEMNKISQRLENKSFVDRAPKEIVEQEKTNYNNLENDIKKISLTIEGI